MIRLSPWTKLVFIFQLLLSGGPVSHALESADFPFRCSLTGHYDGDQKWLVYGPYHHKVQDIEAHRIPEKCVDQAVGLLRSKSKLSDKKTLWTDNEAFISRVTFGYGGSTRTFPTEAFNPYSLTGQIIPIEYRLSEREAFDAPVPWAYTPWEAWGIPLFSWAKFKEHRWSDCQISPSLPGEYEPVVADDLDLEALAGISLSDCVRIAIKRMDAVKIQGWPTLQENRGRELVAKIQGLSPEAHPSSSLGFLFKDQKRNAWVIGQLAWIAAP